MVLYFISHGTLSVYRLCLNMYGSFPFLFVIFVKIRVFSWHRHVLHMGRMNNLNPIEDASVEQFTW